MENSLKIFRQTKNMKQNEFAKIIGVSPSYYYKVESGQRKPSYEFMRKIKKAYPEICVDEMFF